MVKFLNLFYSLKRKTRYILILLMILINAYLDFITPPEFSTRLLYLIPLFLSVWDEDGIIAGIVFSVISTISYFYVEFLQNNIYWHGLYLIWEFIIVCGYFVAFVVIVDKLKISNRLLLKKNEELETLNTQKDKFFSIIAHDLRAPFQYFLGMTKSLAEETGDYSNQEFAQIGKDLNYLADNLYNLLKNLLEWAQMQKGELSYQPEIISLSDIISKNISILKLRYEEKKINIINTISVSSHAYADEKMINSVILNLLSNALKFTYKNGTVTINAKEISSQMIEISITDTGTGMDKNEVGRLFKLGEKFGKKGTEGELSTGLGLLLCKDFVEKNNGKIWAESEEGTGSTFYFTLPSGDHHI